MADDEKNSEKSGDGGGAEAGQGAGKKKKIIIIAAAALVLIAGGGGAAFFMMGSSSEEASPAETSADASHDSKAGEPGKEGEKGHPEKPASEGGKPEAGGGEASKSENKTIGSEGSGEKFGDTYTFKSFYLNLGNPLENHYIRLDLAVEYTGGDTQKAELEKRMPQLRDAIVSVCSRKTREFLLGPHGKDQLRREILIRLNRYLSKPIEAVYITDLLIE